VEDVREKHGVFHPPEDTVVLTERDNCITVFVRSKDVTVSTATTYITPNEARHLATKLRRLARRVDDRIIGG
jgi:hypothetical protein